jgi:hypothetical protein
LNPIEHGRSPSNPISHGHSPSNLTELEKIYREQLKYRCAKMFM